MPCPGTNLQEVVGKMAHDKVEIVEIKLAFGRHQNRCVCLTLPCLQDWVPSPSTHAKLGCHRRGLLGWGADAAWWKAEPPDPPVTSLCRVSLSCFLLRCSSSSTTVYDPRDWSISYSICLPPDPSRCAPQPSVLEAVRMLVNIVTYSLLFERHSVIGNGN